MSEMYDRLMADMKAAMKEHDMVAVNAIRGVIAKAKDLTVNAGKEMTDDAVIVVVSKGAKQREESIAQFAAAGRAELELLKRYLPAQLGEDEVAAVVKAVIAETGASSKKDMGRVMKEVMARVKGQADGKLVSRLVGAALP